MVAGNDSQRRWATQLRLPKFLDNGVSAFQDPTFSSNKVLPIHRWVPWIAGFSASFVSDALNRYLPSKGVILDPFCGVGTTLVEAALSGHRAIGFEINPYAYLACRAKLYSYCIDVERLSAEISRFWEFHRKKLAIDYLPRSKAPKGFRTRTEFYSPAVLRKVLTFHDFVNTIENDNLRDLFRLAFASTMVRYSNYSYEPSLGTRAAAGKEEVTDFPVAETIVGKLRQMAEDIRWYQGQVRDKKVSVEVVNDSFFQYEAHLDRLEPGSVDLIVTSPPYLNNYHYNRNTRPHLYWLGCVRVRPI